MFFNNTKLKHLESVLDSLNYSYTYNDNQKLCDIHLYVFPNVVLTKTKEQLNCTDKELELIKLDFFDFMYTVKKHKKVDNCSKTTNVLWHNLILNTKDYMEFCSTFVGFFVHYDAYNDLYKPTKSYNDTTKKLYKNSIIDNRNYLNYRNETISNYKDDRNTDNSFIDAYILYSILETPKENNYNYQSNTSYESKKSNDDDYSSKSNNCYSNRDNDDRSWFGGSDSGSDCGGSGGGGD